MPADELAPSTRSFGPEFKTCACRWGITWSDFLILVSSLMLRARTCLRGLSASVEALGGGEGPKASIASQAASRSQIDGLGGLQPEMDERKLAFKVIRNLLHIVTTT